MKKIICALLLVSLLATMFVACGEETFECDGCGEEVTSKKHTEEFLGEKVDMCDDCYEEWEEMKDALGDFDLG